MKKIIRILIILLVLQVSESVNASGKWIIEKKTLSKIECRNKQLLNLIDSIFIKDRSCPYYSDSLLLSIRISQYPDRKMAFQLIFETGIASLKRSFLSIKPIGFLKISKHTCYIYNIIPECLFYSTKESYTFYYKDYAPSKKPKRGEVPLIFPDDDSFSSWTYNFDGKEFTLLEMYQPCINKVANANR